MPYEGDRGIPRNFSREEFSSFLFEKINGVNLLVRRDTSPNPLESVRAIERPLLLSD